MSRIKNIIGDILIEELPISYTAVATDITNGKEHWFQNGSLLDAMRASMAIPTVFIPFELDNILYVDGVVFNPVPISALKGKEHDLTVAVSLTGAQTDTPIEKYKDKKMLKKAIELKSNKKSVSKKSMGFRDIGMKSINLMQENITQCHLKQSPADILIEIPQNISGIFDFHKSKELIEYGEEITRNYFNSVKLE